VNAADRIDSTVAHPARRYDYWLGGKDNFEADRKSGDEIARMFPTIRLAAQENRRFMQRVVRYLAGRTASHSSWTSARAFLRSRTCTRWRSRSSRRLGWSMSTTIRLCSRMPARR
jgi:hypothetical protein